MTYFNRLSVFLFCGIMSSSSCQDLLQLKPQLGKLIDLSIEGEKSFYESLKICDSIFEKLETLGDISKLTENEQNILENCEGPMNYYDVLSPGCSWYCGGGLDTLSASSVLKPGKQTRYDVQNIHDLDYSTAWVEGVPGNGIGEYVCYHFPPQNPRINKLIIVNGYVKTDKTWRENSRVKSLKMYINDVPYALLQLEDVKNEQIFQVEPIGYSERKDYDLLIKNPWYTIKFEIIEVYQGSKFKDTAITEIYFDGIDVH